MIKKFDNIWGSSGDTGTPPTTTKQKTGFVRKEKPIRQLFNWLFFQIQNKINLLISDGIPRSYDLSADPYENISKKLYNADGWGLPESLPNIFGAGSSPSLRDINSYVDSNGNSMVLVLNNTGQKIHIINPRTKASSDSGDLTSNLISPVGSWQIQSFLTDGTFVYVLFFDNGAGNAKRLQSFQISNWTENASWPSTGRSVPSNGSDSPHNCMCWATSDIIAVACTWITCTSASSACIATYNALDGSTDDTGSGDCPTGDSYIPNGSICSDGTNLFYVVTSGTAGSFCRICSAVISDLKTGCGGTGFPRARPEEHRVCSVGDGFIYVPVPGGSRTELDIAVLFGDQNDAVIDAIILGKSQTGSNATWTIFSGAIDILFDGINAWILTPLFFFGGGTQYGLLRLDVGKLSKQQRGTPDYARTLYDVCGSAFILSDHTFFCLGFDGRDLFASNNSNAYPLVRLPLAAIR